ncbi:glycosyltransferase family 4 protein [Frisingicoccus sp.]|uniref:glycosyltransferase family 4 protein n=1 Tax=Frisingicoccus sp. TaxID=1918627 RepID=UPI003AB7BD26
MKITILRVGLAIQEKEGTYNVQEIGLSKALCNLGYEADVVYFLDSIERLLCSCKNSNVKYLPCKSIGHQIIIKKSVLSEIDSDAMIIFCDNKLSSNIVIRWCNDRRIPYMCYFGLYKTDSSRVLNKIIGGLITRLNRRELKNSINVTKTNAVKNILEANDVPVKGVIPVGLDEELLRKEEDIGVIVDVRKKLGINLESKVLLFVGRLTEVKNPLLAIEIIERFIECGEDFTLILIGNGRLKAQVLKRIDNSKCKDHIIYIEQVPYELMFQYYMTADCFLNFSNIEIFGMAILESLYYGCRVIAYKAPGPLDIIEHGKNGLLLSNYDVDNWCESIKQAMQTDSLILEGKRTVREKYMWNQIAKAFVELLEEQNE